MYRFKPWMPPLVIVLIVVPAVAGFAIGGPQLGLAVGAFAALALIVFAVRLSNKGTIETKRADDMRRRVLVVAAVELDDDAVAAIRGHGEFDRTGNETEVLVLAPAPTSQLDRWATDLGESRTEAQRRLVMSVAALGKANVDARATVGDSDLVLAVEDSLRSFAATEVILVSGPEGADRSADRAAAELEGRLEQPLHRIELG